MFNLISIMYAAIGGFISGLGVSFVIVFFKYTKYRKEMEQLNTKGGYASYDDLREAVSNCETLTPSDVVDCSMAAADKIITEMVDSFYAVAKKYMDETTVNTIISEAVNHMASDNNEE